MLLGLLQAGYSWLSVREVAGNLAKLTDDRMVKIELISDVKDNANLVARAVRNMVLMHEPADMQAEKKRINDARPLYNATVDLVIEMALANKDAEAAALLLKELRPAQAAYFKTLDAARR